MQKADGEGVGALWRFQYKILTKGMILINNAVKIVTAKTKKFCIEKFSY
jgi:hypothetical protein